MAGGGLILGVGSGRGYGQGVGVWPEAGSHGGWSQVEGGARGGVGEQGAELGA